MYLSKVETESDESQE